MTKCTFNYLEKQWVQNVLHVCLPNCQRRDKAFHPQTVKIFQCKELLIIELLKRYSNDSFMFWQLNTNFGNFKTCLNDMHPSITYRYMVLFFDEPEDFCFFHALHEIYAMMCNLLEHGLRHETDQIKMTETQISFDLADCF